MFLFSRKKHFCNILWVKFGNVSSFFVSQILKGLPWGHVSFFPNLSTGRGQKIVNLVVTFYHVLHCHLFKRLFCTQGASKFGSKKQNKSNMKLLLKHPVKQHTKEPRKSQESPTKSHFSFFHKNSSAFPSCTITEESWCDQMVNQCFQSEIHWFFSLFLPFQSHFLHFWPVSHPWFSSQKMEK